VVNDKEKGPITFFRVYSGILKNRQKVRNVNQSFIEKPSALLRVKADETQILAEIGSGDIGALIGCKNTRSGDTIIDEMDPDKVVLKGLKMPPPAFFCSIEANESREQKALEALLENLSKEDPSIGCKTDEESG